MKNQEKGIITVTPMTIPGRETCLALLKKYGTPEHIILHSERVWQVGKLLGEGLLKNSRPIDMELLEASCLLHDIAKYVCIVEGEGRHDLKGGEILTREGLPELGDIVAQHVVLRDNNPNAIGIEHLTNYADKRVVHDKIVSLDERFVYLKDTYGQNPRAIELLMKMKEQIVAIETRIFALLDFEPDDVIGLIRGYSAD
ncbi:HD domain-containing protein [Thermodesulfobacteriota bacterium]